MTALLDDVLGHAAFLCGDNAPGPWSGATVSVNCSLKKPVAVGSVLKVGASFLFRESSVCSNEL